MGDQLQKSKDDADAFAKLKAGTADVTLTLMPEAQVTCGNTNLLRGPLLVEPGGGEVVTHSRLDCARQMGSGDPKGSNAGQPSRNSFLCANRGGIDERIGDLLTGSWSQPMDRGCSGCNPNTLPPGMRFPPAKP